MPARVAACWPKLRLSQTARTQSCSAASSRMTSSAAVGAAVVDEDDLGDAVGAARR